MPCLEAQQRYFSYRCSDSIPFSDVLVVFQEKRGFLERGGAFARMYATLGRGALSAKSTAGPNILK